MSGLADFITARLGEDEAIAKAAAEFDPPPWRVDWAHPDLPHADQWADVRNADERWVAYNEGVLTREAAEHIARHDPARVLREVAAKRRLIGRYRAALAARAADDDPPDYDPVLAALYGQMRDEAAVYSDHPDYRAEWAPAL